VVNQFKLESKGRLVAQSRGGLMLYNWAAENPDKVQCIVGIYPVCDLRSYPGLKEAAGAYKAYAGRTRKTTDAAQPDRSFGTACEGGVPILHVHGDSDKLVPLEKNSQIVSDRYSALGGKMKLIVVAGKGHAEIPEYFQEPRLVQFLIEGGFSEESPKTKNR
jgi:dipeptidyl aminopeptidase/acylaminoacyl peptidase